MKKLILILVVALLSLTGYETAAQSNPSVRGKVIDESGVPVENATAVLLAGEEQAAGTTSAPDGVFILSAAPGEYTLKVFYLGCEDILRDVELYSDLALGDLVLAVSATRLDAVNVTSRLIVREADRFVVNVAGNPAAIGKDAFEMIKASPGVWVNGSNITINGSAGTSVMVNDRLVRMTGEELENYLRSIKAEDILKIEIIPQSGADHDADSSGGIIKITLARRRDDGLKGNVALSAETGRYVDYRLFPSGGLDYRSGKLNLYVNGGYGINSRDASMREETVYTGDNPGTYESDAAMDDRSQQWRTTLGGIYDIDPRNSVGAEFSYYGRRGDLATEVVSLLDRGGEVSNEGDYTAETRSRYHTGTVNYVRKLDEKGSTFKFIGDYAGSDFDSDNRNTDRFSGVVAGAPGSWNVLSYSFSESQSSIYSASAAFDIVLSPVTTIRTGAKYTRNAIDNTTGNSYVTPEGSFPAVPLTTDYREHIGAAYFIYNTRLGKFGLTAGLRGEYTDIIPKFSGDGMEEKNRKKYFDLFPNLNVSMPLRADYSNMLVLSYSRNITRPHFSYLTPFRNQISAYSYIAGNPDLKATYTSNVSLTAVVAHKYSVTAGASIHRNQVMQKVIREEDATGASDVLVYKFQNIPSTAAYFVALNAPISIKEWWTVTINLTGLYMTQNLDEELAGITGYRPPERQFTLVGNASTNIAIPRWFDVELSGYYMSRVMNANMIVEPMGNLSASVKKRFAGNKLTASLGVGSIFFVEQRVNSYGPGFNKWAYVNNGDHLTFSLSLRYNFSAGASFRAKKVERGAEEDIKRLGGGNGAGGAGGE